MKKLICIFLATIMLLCFAACEKKEDKPANVSSDSSITGTVDSQTSTENTVSNSDSELTRKYNVPLKKVYINAPIWQELEKGLTELFIIQGEKYVSVTHSLDTLNDLKEVHTVNTDTLIYNLQNFCMPKELVVESDSNDTINGIEVYRYEGYFACGENQPYNAYTVGYDFIMDGTPVTVNGGVISKNQPENIKTEIKTIVDEMMGTLRTEE